MAGYVGLLALWLPIELSSSIAPCVPADQIKSYGSDESPIFLPLALIFVSSLIVLGGFLIVVVLKHAICVDIANGANVYSLFFLGLFFIYFKVQKKVCKIIIQLSL